MTVPKITEGAVTKALGLAAPAMAGIPFLWHTVIQHKTKALQEASYGAVQVTIHFSNTAASPISDYVPVTHGKCLGVTA